MMWTIIYRLYPCAAARNTSAKNIVDALNLPLGKPSARDDWLIRDDNSDITKSIQRTNRFGDIRQYPKLLYATEHIDFVVDGSVAI